MTIPYGDQRSVNPALPTDLATLGKALATARSHGIPPSRYTALLWQYRLVQASDRAGMANMIGPSLAAGFLDLGLLPEIIRQLQTRITTLPADLQDQLDRELPSPTVDTTTLSPAELGWLETALLAMQKHVFMDQAAMHESYLTGGTTAVDEMRAAGLIDDGTLGSWQAIDSGQPDAVRSANTRLLRR